MMRVEQLHSADLLLPDNAGDAGECELQFFRLRRWRKEHRWSPLQLRHTAATMIRSRFGLEASQVVLGHARADVTQLYAERDLAKAHAVIAEIG